MQLRATAALLILAAIVGILVLVNPFRKGPEPEKKPPWFYKVSEESIQHIEITHAGKTASFIRKDVGSWYLESPQDIPVDTSRWGGVPILLSGPQSQRLLYEKVDDLKQFGLAQPATVIRVTLKTGRKIEVRLGDESPDGTGFYAQMSDFPQVFLIDVSWGQVLSRLADEPPIPKWHIKENVSRLAGLEITHKGTEVVLRKDGDWHFEDGSAIDQARWSQVLPLLTGPATFKVVQERVEDPTPYGVTKDAGSIISFRFKTTTERGVEYMETASFVVGKPSPEANLQYVYADGFGVVLLVDTSWTETLLRLAEDPPYAKKAQAPSLPG